MSVLLLEDNNKKQDNIFLSTNDEDSDEIWEIIDKEDDGNLLFQLPIKQI